MRSFAGARRRSCAACQDSSLFFAKFTRPGVLAREGDRVDVVCNGAEAVWHSNGGTFYSGIIRDITGCK